MSSFILFLFIQSFLVSDFDDLLDNFFYWSRFDIFDDLAFDLDFTSDYVVFLSSHWSTSFTSIIKWLNMLHLYLFFIFLSTSTVIVITTVGSLLFGLVILLRFNINTSTRTAAESNNYEDNDQYYIGTWICIVTIGNIVYLDRLS